MRVVEGSELAERLEEARAAEGLEEMGRGAAVARVASEMVAFVAFGTMAALVIKMAARKACVALLLAATGTTEGHQQYSARLALEAALLSSVEVEEGARGWSGSVEGLLECLGVTEKS